MGLALVALAMLGACGGHRDSACQDSPAANGAAITNGAVSSTFLGPSRSYADAVVNVSGGPGGPLCTGVLVREHWALTARHCAPAAIAGISREGVPFTLMPEKVVAHPSLDIALVHVTSASSVEGYRFDLSREVAADVVGRPVQLVGYGLTEEGSPSRVPKFVVEEIVELREAELWVDSHGRSGACSGDSGGPMLTRGASGRIEVLGILVGGAASCYGRDRYARADQLAAWVDGIAGDPPGRSSDCDGLTEEGICRLGRAMYCAGGAPVVETCTPSQACGWSRQDQGYRCVARAEDPCGGADDLGVCGLEGATRCDRGRLVIEGCDCATSCGRSLTSGVAECFPS